MLYPIELRTHGRTSIANPIGVTRSQVDQRATTNKLLLFWKEIEDFKAHRFPAGGGVFMGLRQAALTQPPCSAYTKR